MMPARAVRLAMGFCAAALVVWSFVDVARRAVDRRMQLAGRRVHLTVLHWGEPSEDRIVADLVDAYERANPGVKIERINPGDADLTRHKLETMFAAGASPDVFYLPPDQLPRFARLGLIQPIDSYVDAEPSEWLADFFPALKDAFRFDVAAGRAGTGPLYALPKDFTTLAMFVNTNLCEAAGVDWRDIQRHGWTWERFAIESRKISALRGRAEFAGREIYGSFLQTWPTLVRNVLWTFGGDFFATDAGGNVDFRRLTLDSPASQAGLDFLVRVRLEERTSYDPTGIAKDGSEEFINGNIGFTGPLGRWYVPIYKDIQGFRWDVVPMPYATEPASTVFYTGWAMSAQSAQPDEAYRLIHFLCGEPGQLALARSALAIPSRRSAAFSDDFLRAPGSDPDAPIPPHDERIFLDAIAHMRVPLEPEQTEWSPIFEMGLNRAIQTGQDTPAQAARSIQAAWTAELDSPLRGGRWRPMPWRAIVVAAGCVAAAGAIALTWRARRRRLGEVDALGAAEERAGLAFVSPWLLGFVTLTLGPMLVSLVLSFSEWTGLNSLPHADFVGLANFATMFSYDTTFWPSLRVTVYFVLLGVPVTQAAALALALLLDTDVRGVALFRTVYFVPSVVSGVALGVLWLELFNNDHGLVNAVLRPVAALVHARPPNWFGVDVISRPPINDARRWGVPAFVIMGIWSVGSGMIVYLAGLKAVPASLYEAASLDGAGPIRRFVHVTLPMLSPIIFYNVVMGIIGSFQIFTQAYVILGTRSSSGTSATSLGGPDNALLFYVVNLYRQAFDYHNMGYASAMAWALFVIVLVLTVAVFGASRRLVHYDDVVS
ncbi:MAG TPA: extracellular solute-binding protein [Polyangiaceae bacterium]|nr:extracellular solute-binding protein [Polyangiaceae bacterium]